MSTATAVTLDSAGMDSAHGSVPGGRLTPLRSATARLAWPLAAAATAGTACLARYGYVFGAGDHLVLMPRGIANADPAAFAGDWFMESVPQPHWLFDLVTGAGAAVGALPLAYLIYWLLSLLAFGTAAAWAARRFLPAQPWGVLLLGPLLVFGPEKVLGSTTPLLGIALPHMLGACLAFAALAALVNRYWTAAMVASLLAGAVHVQHGANLAPVLLLAAVLATSATPRVRLLLGGTAASLGAGAVVVARWRQIDSGGPEWLEVCRTAIPFHCDANSWTIPYVLAGGLVVGLALVLATRGRESWREVVPAVGLPACGLALAVLADLFDVPVFGQLAQASNAYRLSAAVLPFAALSLLILILRFPSGPVAGLVAVLVVAGWSLANDASLDLGSGTDLVRNLFLVVAITAAVAGLAATPSTRRAVAVAFALVVAVQVGGDDSVPLSVGYWSRDPVVAAGLDLRSSLPAGSVVATAPGRLEPTIAERAVIADCKRVPYGGRLWRQYRERLSALGGGCIGNASGFADLSAADVLALRDRYGATHVLLEGADPKLGYALERWALRWHRVDADRTAAPAGGLWLFQLPRR